MSINLTNISQLEAKIDKAMKQMKSLTTTTRTEFVIEAVEHYLNELKKKKVISWVVPNKYLLNDLQRQPKTRQTESLNKKNSPVKKHL